MNCERRLHARARAKGSRRHGAGGARRHGAGSARQQRANGLARRLHPHGCARPEPAPPPSFPGPLVLQPHLKSGTRRRLWAVGCGL
eukprot:7327767-Prymnesium_polylepis.1